MPFAKNPDNRYQSGHDLGRALYLVARFAGTKAFSAAESPLLVFMRPAHPRDLLAIASAVLLLASAVTAAGSLGQWVRRRLTPAVAEVPARGSGRSCYVYLGTHGRARIPTPQGCRPGRKPAMRNPFQKLRPASATRRRPGRRRAKVVSPNASFADPSPLP